MKVRKRDQRMRKWPTVTKGRCMDDKTVMSLEHVTVSFGGLKAVAGVNMRVPVGSIHAVIGPNGAGKTTLLNAISGHVRVEQGQIIVDEQDFTDLSAHKRAVLGVGRTFQHSELFDNLSIAENVMCGAYSHSRYGVIGGTIGIPRVWHQEQETMVRALELLELVGLRERANEYPGNLPGGQRRMVGLARALAGNPRVLLVDELSAGMNQTERNNVLELLRHLNEGMELTMVLIEHDLDFVSSLAATASVLDGGVLIAEGKIVEVLSSPQVVEAYVGI